MLKSQTQIKKAVNYQLLFFIEQQQTKKTITIKNMTFFLQHRVFAKRFLSLCWKVPKKHKKAWASKKTGGINNGPTIITIITIVTIFIIVTMRTNIHFYLLLGRAFEIACQVELLGQRRSRFGWYNILQPFRRAVSQIALQVSLIKLNRILIVHHNSRSKS